MNRIRPAKQIERIACYIRVSSQEQKLHGLSLPAQVQKLEDYAKEHDMKIVDWYKDEGVSGRKLIRNRPELQRMIQDAEKGLFDRIIFIKLDRFFRSVAEYHECMKRIAPVVWTTTEEEYDLTTANGRMLVNMKLTIAEMEADITGERINLVNEYKISTGQPLSGSMPFGFKIVVGDNGRKKIVRDTEVEDILRDAIDHCMTHQSVRKAVTYLNAKYHVSLFYNNFLSLLKNPFLYGSYRGNDNYCEAYITKVEFDKLQEIVNDRNLKENTRKNRTYIFSGLILCPECGRKLAGCTQLRVNRTDKEKQYMKRYRCNFNNCSKTCSFSKSLMENTFEAKMLEGIEKYFEDAKLRSAEVQESDSNKILKYDIEDIHARIDRLNYSWQTGKIRTVEQYEKDYASLTEELEIAEQEKGSVVVNDFSKIEAILHAGWKNIYNSLEDEYKRAFWHSFIQSIEIDWTTNTKEITRVNFF